MISFLRAMFRALKALLADPGARATMLVSIVIYSMLYPQPYRTEVVRDMPIAVIDQDGSGASRTLFRRIDNADTVAILASVNSLAEAEEMFFRREVFGVVIVPPFFERDLLDGRAAPIAAFGDGSYFLAYGSMIRAVSLAARSLGAEVQYARLTTSGTDAATAIAAVSPVTVTAVPLFNPQGGYASYVLPAAFVLILQQTLLMGIGILHAGRRPLSGVDTVATPLAYLLLYCGWIAGTQLLLPWLYAIPYIGTAKGLYIVAIPFLTATIAMGFALARLIPWREGVIFLLAVMGLPLFFLSGMSWPVESVPEPIRTLANLIPSTTAMKAMVKIDQMAAPVSAVFDEVGTLLMLTAGYSAIALVLSGSWFRKQTRRS
ncbi:ABC transporter permease [Lutimaribacter marinistellae]|uniref:ABC transporter permease n=1 Tax=Lutimaribacter marinistellae TaxID=1820329 RepID=A0ABV7TAY2_9RHOB